MALTIKYGPWIGITIDLQNYDNNATFLILKIILLLYYTMYTIEDILASIREIYST